MVANLIYGPSCISFEYALFEYGLIAERPTTITSLALGKNRKFDTPLGFFEYRALAKEKFKWGIDYQDLGDQGGYFIASREKALIDFVYRTPHIRTREQLAFFLFEEMRMDPSDFAQLDRQELKKIAKAYGKRSVLMLLDKMYFTR